MTDEEFVEFERLDDWYEIRYLDMLHDIKYDIDTSDYFEVHDDD
jgi:hypothetical protein